MNCAINLFTFFIIIIVALYSSNRTMSKYRVKKTINTYISDNTGHSTYNGPYTTTYYIIAFLSKVYIIAYIYRTVLFPFCMTQM